MVEINDDMNFNELNWHDSIIKNIIIDRNNPGRNDTIQIEIVWTNGVSNVISFKDIYWANLDMNFGIVSNESILKAFSEGNENDAVKKTYSIWKGMIDDIYLNYYEMETNSTRSIIKVVAQRFELLNR